MEAGRELDALVAEKVMGLTRHNESYVTESIGKVLRFVWRDGCGDCVYSGDMFLPRYSTNIAAAWEVVNHLMCLGYDNKWFFQLHYDNVELWDASFYKESTSDGGGPEVWSTAGAPALAICLAALKAVSQEGQR